MSQNLQPSTFAFSPPLWDPENFVDSCSVSVPEPVGAAEAVKLAGVLDGTIPSDTD
jgi:hypothetical protein